MAKLRRTAEKRRTGDPDEELLPTVSREIPPGLPEVPERNDWRSHKRDQRNWWANPGDAPEPRPIFEIEPPYPKRWIKRRFRRHLSLAGVHPP